MSDTPLADGMVGADDFDDGFRVQRVPEEHMQPLMAPAAMRNFQPFQQQQAIAPEPIKQEVNYDLILAATLSALEIIEVFQAMPVSQFMSAARSIAGSIHDGIQEAQK